MVSNNHVYLETTGDLDCLPVIRRASNGYCFYADNTAGVTKRWVVGAIFWLSVGSDRSKPPFLASNTLVPTRLVLLGFPIPERLIESKRVLPLALVALAALTLIESYYKLDYSLGIFYTIPVVVAAGSLNRLQIILFGLLCACARGWFTPAASGVEFLLKFAMASIAYCGSGLLVVEMSNNRRRLIENYARLKLEKDLRHRAEEQLRALAESSPAAILTINAEAEVQAANLAAHEMLGYAPNSLVGEKVDSNFPMFANALRLAMKDRAVRTSITGWAQRRDEHIFPIQAWISVHGQGEGRCLAAIVVDMSEEVRDRERENFQHLLDYNRLLAGAVSHEIRNMCSAISVVCSNLSVRTELQNSADFDALNQLVHGLSKMASFELRQTAENQTLHSDLRSVLDQLRLVIEPDWEEIEGEVVWHIPHGIPPVSGDAHGLLQIFLNLCQNSVRAVQNMPERRLIIFVEVHKQDAVITFSDSGRGVANPDDLFHPFRPGANGSGLGLYISRALARNFGGDLLYVPTPAGSQFRVMVPAAHQPAQKVASAAE
jgi:two-component system sensor kinase FixL